MNSVLFYVDTSSLLHARHYLVCEKTGVESEYYSPGVRQGQHVVDALDMCRQKRDKIRVATSFLTRFEMNQRYRKWIAKELFLAKKVPLETIDGRDREVLDTLRKMPDDIKREFREEFNNNANWSRGWEYNDIVEFDVPDKFDMFEIADLLQELAPGIDFMDASHAAIALLQGASYFVSGDGPLRTHIEEIDREVQEIAHLPEGSVQDISLKNIQARNFTPIKALGAKAFLDAVEKV